jgi:hypothetical protein
LNVKHAPASLARSTKCHAAFLPSWSHLRSSRKGRGRQSVCWGYWEISLPAPVTSGLSRRVSSRATVSRPSPEPSSLDLSPLSLEEPVREPGFPSDDDGIVARIERGGDDCADSGRLSHCRYRAIFFHDRPGIHGAVNCDPDKLPPVGLRHGSGIFQDVHMNVAIREEEMYRLRH